MDQVKQVDYPILVILTNKECIHCVKMRGKTGWPSSKLSKSFPPKKDSEDYTRWDDDFFILALQGGITDGKQKVRIIEIIFDTLKSSNKIDEVTFFDLIDNRLSIKKYKESHIGKTKVLRKNKNGFIDVSEINTNFDDFTKKYIPVEKLRKYIHVFPSFVYIHSIIWENAIRDPNASLYARVQGWKTVRDGNDRRIYKILREKRPIIEESNRNPIDVLRKLIAFKLEPLYLPSDH